MNATSQLRVDDSATLEGWYGRNRPHYAPKTPKVLVQKAQRFMEREFPRLLQEDGLLPHLWRAVEHAFRHFDPAAGSPDLPVGERFLLAYHVWARQRLKKANGRLMRANARRPRLLPPSILDQLPAPPEAKAEADLPHDGWCRLLFERALHLLDDRTRKCLELRRDGDEPWEIAEHLNISPKTAANRYSEGRLVRAVRQAVRRLVLGLPLQDRLRLVAYLMGPSALSPEEAGRLLCLPPEELWPLLVQAAGVPVPTHEEAVALVSPPPLTRVA